MQENGIALFPVQLAPGLIGQVQLRNDAPMLEVKLVLVLEELVAAQSLAIGTSDPHRAILLQPEGGGARVEHWRSFNYYNFLKKIFRP